MYPTSPRFKAALQTSHRMVAKAQVWSRGEPVAELQFQPGSSVTVDITTTQRRVGAFTVFDPMDKLTPKGAKDLLGNAGNEIRPFRGIAYADGTQELVPLGVFRTSVTSIDDGPDGLVINLTGFDRSYPVSRNRFSMPFVVPAGGTAADAILAIFRSQAPQYVTTVNFLTNGALSTRLPQQVYAINDDPWKAAEDIATSVGAEALFDVLGVLTLRPFASAVDENPLSPTYVNTFGHFVDSQTSTLVTNPDQAQAMANGLLLKTTGIMEDIQFLSVVDPSLDGYDVTLIERQRLNVNSLYSMSNLVIPLDANTGMTGATRQRIAVR